MYGTLFFRLFGYNEKVNDKAHDTATLHHLPLPELPSLTEISRVLLATAAAILLLLACPDPAHAHAVVIESSPRDGARLVSPPGAIVLRFNARIEKPLARLSLTTADGRNVPLPPLSPEQWNKGGDDRLMIPLPHLGPGSYFLRYKILSADGHATPGILRFTVTGGH